MGGWFQPYDWGTREPRRRQELPREPSTRFASWSDGGGNPHNVTAPASSGTFTGNYVTQYYLTTNVWPAGDGTIKPEQFPAAGTTQEPRQP